MGIGADGSGTVTVMIAAGTFILTVLTAVWAAAWRAGSIKADQDRKTMKLEAELRADLEKRFEAARKDRSEEIAASARAFGETAMALRTKIGEVELWARDNLVRTQTFQNFLESSTKSNENLRADMNSNYKQIMERLDRMSDRQSQN